MSTASDPKLRSREAIESWIKTWIGNELNLALDEIEMDKSFLNYGMNSVQAMMLVGDLEDQLARRLSPTLIWDYPSVDTLTEYLITVGSDETAVLGSVQPAEKKPDVVDESPQALLNRIDDLSEQEMDLLLRDYLRKPR